MSGDGGEVDEAGASTTTQSTTTSDVATYVRPFFYEPRAARDAREFVDDHADREEAEGRPRRHRIVLFPVF